MIHNDLEKNDFELLLKEHLIERSITTDNVFTVTNSNCLTLSKEVSVNKLQVVSLKCELFLKLCMEYQTREGNLEEFFTMKIRLIHQQV